MHLILRTKNAIYSSLPLTENTSECIQQ